MQICRVAARPALQRLTGPYRSLSSMDVPSGQTSTIADYRMSANVEPVPEALRKQTILYYSPENEELARKIAESAHGSIELGSIQWR